MLKKIGLSLLCLLCLAACSKQNDTVQGYVEGELVYVSSDYPGVLETLSVHRGQYIHQDDALYQLAPNPEALDFEAARDTAKQQAATLEDLKLPDRLEQIQAIEGQIEQTEAAITFYKKQVGRFKTLAKQDAASEEEYDQAKFNYERNVGQLDELKANLRLAKLGSRENQIKAQAYATKSTEAMAKKVAWQMAQKSRRASVDGIVFDTYYWPSEYVGAGEPVLSILAPQYIRIIFYVPEPDLGRLRVGQTISFQCDSCENPTKATISYISNEAEYTPPVIFSDEMREKLVYEIKADIDPSVALHFHPGQPVDVTF